MLKASIPGCQSLEKISDTEMTATVQAKVGPVKATFNGHVTLSNIDPPNGYTITGEGKGGVAGFAKGGADVKLADDGDGDAAHLHGQRPGRRQARPDRRPADRCHRQADGRPVLHRLRRQGRWAAAPAGAVADDDGETAVVADVIGDPEVTAEAVEEQLEVAAGRGVLGGPMMWGLLALIVVIVDPASASLRWKEPV